MSDLDRLLEMLTTGLRPGRPALAAYVLKHGVEWRPGPRRDGLDVGVNHYQCWEKVEHVLATRPDLGFDYVQGYALKPAGLEPECHEHAWLGSEDGTALDVHWPDTAGCTYFGVRVETAAYHQALEERQPSEPVLDFLAKEPIPAA